MHRWVCAYVSVVLYVSNLEHVRVIQYPVSCPCSGNTFFFFVAHEEENEI